MCIKRFVSKNWPLKLWDLAGWMWHCSKGLWLTGQGHNSVEGDLLYWSCHDGYEPHPQNSFMATSRRVFDESLETGLAMLTQKTDHHSTCQAFSFEKPQHLYCYHCILWPLGFAVNYVFCGDQNKWGLLTCDHDRLCGERGCFREIKMQHALPWPVVIWGVGFDAGLSWKDRLRVLEPFHPHPSERGVRAQ